MMSKKATHSGSCQLCGRVQRLPGGRLAKHGYNVRFGFFSGTCPGSSHQPYEESCGLIERGREIVLAHVESLRERAAAVRELKHLVFVHEYVPATWARGERQSRYVWRELPIDELQVIGRYGYDWKRADGSGGPQHSVPYSGEGGLAGIVAHLNGVRADAYEKEAAEHAEYAAWLAERLASWKPAELKPLAA